MGQDTDQLTGDIATTRDNLSSHLDELQDKVSPSAIAGRQKAAARDKVRGVKDKVMGSAQGAGGSVGSTASDAADTARDQFQGSPLAAGLAAFGLGMVVASLIPATKAESRAAAQVKDVVQDKAQPLVQDAKDAAAEVGQNLKENATEAADQVRQTGTEAVSNVKDEGQSSVQTVRSDAGA